MMLLPLKLSSKNSSRTIVAKGILGCVIYGRLTMGTREELSSYCSRVSYPNFTPLPMSSDSSQAGDINHLFTRIGIFTIHLWKKWDCPCYSPGGCKRPYWHKKTRVPIQYPCMSSQIQNIYRPGSKVGLRSSAPTAFQMTFSQSPMTVSIQLKKYIQRKPAVRFY
jgi:hypothetical protein